MLLLLLGAPSVVHVIADPPNRLIVYPDVDVPVQAGPARFVVYPDVDLED